jgi:hypothetical protein
MRWWHWLIMVAAGGLVSGLAWLGASFVVKGSGGLTSPVSYAGDVGVPGQVSLPPLRERPVPGWRMDLKAVLADINRPHVEHVGDVGDHAYFTVTGSVGTTGQRSAWLLGVDVVQGVPLFTPVSIEHPVEVSCLLNGTARVLCLNRDYGDAPGEALVLDAQTGAVLSRTVSTLQVDGFGDEAKVVQVGSYAVAYEPGVGWRGIDDQAQFTWTVEGVEGDLKVLKHQPGMPASDIAVAKVGKDRSVAFSAVDGTVLKTSGELVPVVGGFVDRERKSGSRYRSTTFTFFDDSGNQVGRYDNQAGSPDLFRPGLTSTELPVLSLVSSDQLLVLDNRGTPMTVVGLGSEGIPYTIGFSGGSMFTMRSDWSAADLSTVIVEKFDLRGGNRVSSCTGLPMEEDKFIGSDGTVVVAPQADVGEDEAPTVGFDLDTCSVLWTIPEPGPMWTVRSTLVQARPGSGELISLVPPAR